MSNHDYREPTNDELWAQPPVQQPPAVQPSQELAPLSQRAVPATPHKPPTADRTQFVLAIVSMALGIPLSAIAGGIAGLPGLIIAWVGIVLVNVIYGRYRSH